MKKTFAILFSTLIFYGCQEASKIGVNFVIAKFYENTNKINSLEYRIHRIDTFGLGGTVWDNTGFVMIEKETRNTLFGFSFYAKRDDVSIENTYEQGIGLEISAKDKAYQILKVNRGFLGPTGGQMVQKNIFKLESIYQKVSLQDTTSLKTILQASLRSIQNH
jgi:hypothetical protein